MAASQLVVTSDHRLRTKLLLVEALGVVPMVVHMEALMVVLQDLHRTLAIRTVITVVLRACHQARLLLPLAQATVSP
jgi:hypothetical protein